MFFFILSFINNISCKIGVFWFSILQLFSKIVVFSNCEKADFTTIFRNYNYFPKISPGWSQTRAPFDHIRAEGLLSSISMMTWPRAHEHRVRVGREADDLQGSKKRVRAIARVHHCLQPRERFVREDVKRRPRTSG